LEAGFAAARCAEVAMLADEIPELGRNGSAAQHGDIMSDEIVERGKLQPPGVGRPNEEDPFLPPISLAIAAAAAMSMCDAIS
jgi:hypothetical protein